MNDLAGSRHQVRCKCCGGYTGEIEELPDKPATFRICSKCRDQLVETSVPYAHPLRYEAERAGKVYCWEPVADQLGWFHIWIQDSIESFGLP